MGELLTIPVDQLKAGDNPRSNASENLDELKASVEQDGILDPLRVVRSNGHYVIESGHRRYLAALAAGLPTVPAIVEDENAEDTYIRAIVTNVQREDMNPVDEGVAYQRLKGRGLTVAGIAERLGVAQSRVTSRLQLLDLPTKIVELYYDAKLPLSARTSLGELAKVSEDLAETVAVECAGKAEWAEVLAKEPMRVAKFIARQPNHAERFTVIPGRLEVPAKKVGKELAKRMEKLSSQWQPYQPTFSVEDAQAAVATGVAFSVKDDSEVVVCDDAWILQQLPVVIEREEKRRAEYAESEARRIAREKVQQGEHTPAEEQEAEAAKEWRRKERQALLAGRDTAHALNCELGSRLYAELKPITKDVPLALAQLLIAEHVKAYGRDLFHMGLRYCLPQYLKEEQQKNGKVKRVYGDLSANEERDALREFLAVDKGDELIRRWLIVLGCARFADQGVVAQSDRGPGWNHGTPQQFVPGVGGGAGGNEPPVKYLDGLLRELVPAKLRGRSRPSEVPLEKLRKEFEQQAAKTA